MQTSFRFIGEMVSHTPIWVWILFVYLIVRGVKALRGGVTSLRRMIIIPLGFSIWGLWGVYDTFHGSPLSISVWLASFCVGIGLGLLRASRTHIQVDLSRQLVALPGSAMVLVLVLVTFGVKYSLGVLQAVRPEATGTFLFLFVDVGATGVIAGMFAGRLFGIWQKMKVAPQMELATP